MKQLFVTWLWKTQTILPFLSHSLDFNVFVFVINFSEMCHCGLSLIEVYQSEPMETAKDGTLWRKEEVGTPLQFTPIQLYAAEGDPTARARRNLKKKASVIIIIKKTRLEFWLFH